MPASRMGLLRRPGFWIALAVALLAGGIAFWRILPPAVPTVRLRRSAIEQHLVASGRVSVPARVELSALVAGRVVAVHAVEGQRVRTGEVLAQIDDTEAQAGVAQAQAAVAQAQAKVEQLERVGAIVAAENLREAEANLRQSQAALRRTHRLARGGAATAQALDDARRAYERARARRAAAEAQRVASTPVGADARVALTALRQAQAQLAGARARLADTRLVALEDGVVLTRSVEPGDVVQPGRLLFTLAADRAPELVFQPDERNLADLHVGQRARAAADAYPSQPFDAEISYIAPSIDPRRGSVEVRLRILDPPAFLRPDMTVSIDLTVARRREAEVLPADAVHGAAGSTPWVLVVEHGRVVRRDVRLGLRGSGSVQVVSGLPAQADVVAPVARPPSPGQRVRGRRADQ